MQNRFFLALMLSLMLFLIYSGLNPPAKKPVEPGGDEPKTEQAGPEQPTDRDGDAVPASRPAGSEQPPEAAPFAGPLVLESEALRVAFDQRGGVVQTVWLMEHWEHVEDKGEPGFENKLRFVRSYEGGPRAFELTDSAMTDEQAGWLNERLWETAGPGPDGAIEFATEVVQSGQRFRLVRRYAFHPESRHRLRVTMRLDHLEGEAAGFERHYWMNTSGGVFPEERADKVSDYGRRVAHVQIGARDKRSLDLTIFNAADLLGEESRGTVPDAVFGCDMGVYFGAYLAPIGDVGRREIRARAVDPLKAAGIAEPSRDDLERLGPARAYTQVSFALAPQAAGQSSELAFDWYVGAKDHRSIKGEYREGEELREDYLDVADQELTAQGSCCSFGPLDWIVQAISKAVVWLISFFTGIFGSTGVAIIVLTLFVKLLMFPITRKSQVAMQEHSRKMARIKPKIEAIKEKYKNDQQKAAAEQMKMMKEEGVGMLPLAGCLPLFLQMPIFFGLFAAIRFDYELRHAAFLWCRDLSMPDTVIAFTPIHLPCSFCMPGGGGSIDGLNVFPLLMIAAMFFHQLGMPKSPDPQMQQQQKMMMFMPLFFGVLMYGYAAGLSVYWLSSSLFGIFEQRVIKKLFPIDKDGAVQKPAAS